MAPQPPTLQIDPRLLQAVQNLVAATNALQQTMAKVPFAFVVAPATATSAGTPGQVAYDATHFYVCVATNTWVRATLASF